MAGGSLPSGPLPTGERGPAIDAVQILMIALALSAVVLRFIGRRRSAAGIWWDDWMIFAALIFSMAINFLNLAAVQLGLGKHIWDVPDHGQGYLRSLFVLEIFYSTALALNKLGVLFMYRRLFGVERKLTVAVNIVAAIVIAWWIGVEAATVAQCNPIDKWWDYSKQGFCIKVIPFYEGSAIPNVLIDIIIVLLPQPILWKLRMSTSNKIALRGIFLLGAFTAMASVGRLVAIISFHDATDFTYTAFDAIMWYSLEPAVGITCACLPCMGPLFRRLPGRPFDTEKTNSSDQYPTQLQDIELSILESNHIDRLSMDAASVAKLTQSRNSYRASIYHGSTEDIAPPASLNNMKAIHVRTDMHVTSPTTP